MIFFNLNCNKYFTQNKDKLIVYIVHIIKTIMHITKQITYVIKQVINENQFDFFVKLKF